jgi:hypothetical protein
LNARMLISLFNNLRGGKDERILSSNLLCFNGIHQM